MTADDHCPHCNASMQGNEIPAEHREHKPDHDQQVERYGRCYCLPWGDKTHFSRIIGHEVSGVYDGVLYWSCPDCGMAWARWGDGGRFGAQSAEWVARHNAATEKGGE